MLFTPKLQVEAGCLRWGQVKLGSHMLLMYLEVVARTAWTASRANENMRRRQQDPSQNFTPACLRSWTRINFAGMPAIKTRMTNVAGHLCSHIGTVSQAMSQVHRRHMRTRLNVRSNLRRFTNLSDPARNPATTPACSHFSWYPPH